MTSIIHDSRYNFDKTKNIKAWTVHREMIFLYMFTELGLLDITIRYLEIGTFEGASACWVMTNTNRSFIMCVDIYEQETLCSNLNVASGHLPVSPWDEEIVEKWRTDEYTIPLRFPFYCGYSHMVLPKLIEEETKEFDVIYIDGDHEYECVLQDIKNAEILLKPGGIMILDDYQEVVWHGVKQAVDEWITDDWEILCDEYMLWLRKK
jgi:predicted O-methyltransferase YrrM